MADDDQAEITLDWRAVTDAAASAPQLARSDRQDRAGDGKRRRSPRGPSREHQRASADEQLAFDFGSSSRPSQIIPFPLGRRALLVAKLAAAAASASTADIGESLLQARLSQIRRAMHRNGARSETAISAQIGQLEGAARAAMARLKAGRRPAHG